MRATIIGSILLSFVVCIAADAIAIAVHYGVTLPGRCSHGAQLAICTSAFLGKEIVYGDLAIVVVLFLLITLGSAVSRRYAAH